MLKSDVLLNVLV